MSNALFSDGIKILKIEGRSNPSASARHEFFAASSRATTRRADEGMCGDAQKNVGEPRLRIDAVHFGGDDEAVRGGGALAAAVGAAEL